VKKPSRDRNVIRAKDIYLFSDDVGSRVVYYTQKGVRHTVNFKASTSQLQCAIVKLQRLFAKALRSERDHQRWMLNHLAQVARDTEEAGK